MSNTFAQQRANMVEGQLRPNKVNQAAILSRFGRVERESFTPAAAQPEAYLDQPLPLKPGRDMFSPLTTARLVQALGVGQGDTVLVLAAGTGYSAAILAGLCKQVIAVEDDAALAKQATAAFKAQNITNIQLVQSNPSEGYTASGPYNAILIDAPYAELPAFLIGQLAQGGRLAGVRVGADGLPEATILTKHANSLVMEVLFETPGTVHPAFATSEKFVF